MEEVYFSYSNSESLYNGSVLVDKLTLILETENSMAWQDYLSRIMQASKINEEQYSLSSNSTSTVLYISGITGADIRPIVNVHVFKVSLNML
jgi:hypothetical protein